MNRYPALCNTVDLSVIGYVAYPWCAAIAANDAVTASKASAHCSTAGRNSPKLMRDATPNHRLFGDALRFPWDRHIFDRVVSTIEAEQREKPQQ